MAAQGTSYGGAGDLVSRRHTSSQIRAMKCVFGFDVFPKEEEDTQTIQELIAQLSKVKKRRQKLLDLLKPKIK